MPKHVTMAHVAAKAGVHTSTVSLCLRNSPRISAETRALVLRAAQEIGYHPHPFVSTLMHARRRGRAASNSPLLAFVYLHEPGTTWKSWLPELGLCLGEARRQAQYRGFRLEEFSAPFDEARRLGETLYWRGIRGIILAPFRHSVETLDWDWTQFAVVALGPSLRERRVHRVMHHHFQSMLAVMEKCHRLGYRRIGLALQEEVNRKTDRRWQGSHLLKQRELAMPNPPPPLLTPDWSREVFLEWLEKWQPDAIIGALANIIHWLKDRGNEVPKEIGLAALTAPLGSHHSGIDQNWPVQGKRAVNLLIALLQENLLGLHNLPNILLVTGRWNPGKTLPDRTAGAVLHPSPPVPSASPNPPETPMAGNTVSMKDVARAAHVHSSTVSLALSNSPLLAEQTRLHVQNVAQALGYRAHPHLRALMRKRRTGNPPGEPPTLGFITFLPRPEGSIKHLPQLSICIENARRHALAVGYQLDLIWSPIDRTSPTELAERLRANGISGIILTSLPRPRATLDWPWDDFAAVAIGSSLGEPRVHRVRGDYFKMLVMATENCLSLGYRRVGLAMSTEMNHRTDEQWLAAFLTHLDRPGVDHPVEPLLAEKWSKTVFLRWLAKNQPDAVIVSHLAEPRRWLEEAGYGIPGDIGLVSLSVSEIGSEETGIYENWGLLGRRAVSMLHDLLLDNELGLQDSPNISLVDGSWNPGRTLPRKS